MKKLMTMLAAAAMAFGLYADTITPIDSFDAANGGSLTDGRWKLDNVQIEDAIDEAKIEDSLLKIQTGSKKLTREFLAESASTNIPADGLYFDINLSFLDPIDGSEPLTDVAGAKIAAAVIDNSAALEEIPDTQLDSSTNLYVIGAYYDSEKGDYVQRAYMFQNTDLSGTTSKRLTIKMYDNVMDAEKRPGFRFFVGGVDQALKVKYTFPILENGTIDFANPTAVSKTPNYLGVAATALKPTIRSRYAEANLILSLGGGVGSSAVKAVDFVGKANIADFKLTEDPDFIGPDAYVMSVDYNSEDVTINGVTGEVGNPTFANGVITYDANETKLTVAATYKEGLTIVKWTINGDPVPADAAFTPVKNGTLAITAVAPAATVDGKAFESFFDDEETGTPGALTYVNEHGGTLKLAADAIQSAAAGKPITFESASPVILDLAGKTIKGSDDESASVKVAYGTALTITNSTVEIGHVAVPYYNDGEGPELTGDTSIDSDGTLVIAGGIMDGKVYIAEGATITGGTFEDEIEPDEEEILETIGGLFNVNKFAQNEIPGVDYTTYEAVDNGEGYWKVQEKTIVNVAQVIVTVEEGIEETNEYATADAALAAVWAAEAAGQFPIRVKALADDGLTITFEDNTAKIAKGVTIGINKPDDQEVWVVDGELEYHGAIDGRVFADAIKVPPYGETIALGTNAMITVNYPTSLHYGCFSAPTGYTVQGFVDHGTAQFRVVKICTLTLAAGTGTTLSLVEGEDEVYYGPTVELPAGTKVGIRVTLTDAAKYKNPTIKVDGEVFTGGPYEVEKDVTIESSATEIQFATLTIDDSDAGVQSLTATNAAGDVFNTGATFDKDLAVKLYACYTLSETGAELDAEKSVLEVTMDADRTIKVVTKPLISPIDEAKEADVDGFNELPTPEAKAKATTNFGQLYNAVGGTKEATDAWVAKVYGQGGKIPAAKLALADAADIAISTTFDLKVMVEPTIDAPAVIAATEGPAAFSFAIKDGNDPVEIATLTANVKKLIKYAAALTGGTGFDYAKDTEVSIGLNGDKNAITAEFVAGPAAGFMKADFTTVDKE